MDSDQGNHNWCLNSGWELERALKLAFFAELIYIKKISTEICDICKCYRLIWGVCTSLVGEV